MRYFLLTMAILMASVVPAAAVDVDTVAMLAADTDAFLCDGNLYAFDFVNNGSAKTIYLAQHNDSFSVQGVNVLDVFTAVRVNGVQTDVLMESLGSVNGTPSRAQGPAASWPSGAVIRQVFRCYGPGGGVGARSQLWIWVGANQVP